MTTLQEAANVASKKIGTATQTAAQQVPVLEVEPRNGADSSSLIIKGAMKEPA